MLISALMLVASIKYIRIEMDFGSYLFLGIPAWIGQLIMPAGFSMILFRFLIRTVDQFIEVTKGVNT